MENDRQHWFSFRAAKGPIAEYLSKDLLVRLHEEYEELLACENKKERSQRAQTLWKDWDKKIKIVESAVVDEEDDIDFMDDAEDRITAVRKEAKKQDKDALLQIQWNRKFDIKFAWLLRRWGWVCTNPERISELCRIR